MTANSRHDKTLHQRKTANASFASPVRQVDHQRLEIRVTVLELTIAEKLDSVSRETNALRESVDGRLNAATQNMNSMQQSIHALEGTTATMQTSIHALEATTATMQTSIHALEATTATMQTSIHALEATTATMQKSIHSLEVTTATMQTSIHALEATTASMQKSIHSLEVTTTSMQQSIHGLKQSMDANFDRLSDKITSMNAILHQRVDQCATKLQVFLWGFVMLSALASGALGLASAVYRHHGESFTSEAIDAVRGK
jgi:chromosome segregation ATPase